MTAANRSSATTRSRRPEPRPREFRQVARTQDKLDQRGAMCGGVGIQGEHVGRVKGKIRGCGIDGAVRLSSVSGISLSQKTVIDCTTAKALKNWLDTTAKPALLNSGGGLKSIRVAAHYSCRTRNNKPGARISEHGKGRAIDISGFRLQGWYPDYCAKRMAGEAHRADFEADAQRCLWSVWYCSGTGVRPIPSGSLPF